MLEEKKRFLVRKTFLAGGSILLFICLLTVMAVTNGGYWMWRARFGDVEAQYTLGIQYWTGYEGTTRDLSKAEYWLTAAAKQGDYNAIYDLVRFNREQRGISDDQTLFWEAELEKVEVLEKLRQQAIDELAKGRQDAAQDILQQMLKIAQTQNNQIYEQEAKSLLQADSTSIISSN